MKPTYDGFRMIVNLRGKTFNVNRLVLLAFVGPCPDGMEGCHNDGNHRNNALSNLRWDTHISNEKDKKRHGTSNEGIRNGTAKLMEEQVREIRRLYATGAYSLTQLARKFGMFFTILHPLIHRRTWKHVA